MLGGRGGYYLALIRLFADVNSTVEVMNKGLSHMTYIYLCAPYHGASRALGVGEGFLLDVVVRLWGFGWFDG